MVSKDLCVALEDGAKKLLDLATELKAYAEQMQENIRLLHIANEKLKAANANLEKAKALLNSRKYLDKSLN